MNDKKEFTSVDMIDAFWCGFGFREKTILAQIKKYTLRIDDGKIDSNLSGKAIDNMFKEKAMFKAAGERK